MQSAGRNVGVFLSFLKLKHFRFALFIRSYRTESRKKPNLNQPFFNRNNYVERNKMTLSVILKIEILKAKTSGSGHQTVEFVNPLVWARRACAIVFSKAHAHMHFKCRARVAFLRICASAVQGPPLDNLDPYSTL